MIHRLIAPPRTAWGDTAPWRFTPAPLEYEVSGALPSARAVWTDTPDGVRLRLGCLGHGGRGTVLILPGRTEYLEKYGRTARRFAEAGFGSVAIDFRGQGLSDRLTKDPRIGHVRRFRDYQTDVAALVAYAQAEEMPRPWVLLGHSMGGAIGLRALIEDLPVRAAVFSAPMWGIQMPPALRPVAWGLGSIAHLAQLNGWVTPLTKRETYVRIAPAEDNFLTNDADMFAYMRRQLEACPGLDLGGPSVPWLFRALWECRLLRWVARPSQPTLTVLPLEEDIVCPDAIRGLVERWPDGRLLEIEGGKHETMMETSARRDQFFDEVIGFFSQAVPAEEPRSSRPAPRPNPSQAVAPLAIAAGVVRSRSD